MKCHFCFAQRTSTKLSKEHLLSDPVAEAFGLDRSAVLAQFGSDSDEVLIGRAEDVTVRFVCEVQQHLDEQA